MQNIKVNKDRLVGILKKNRESHTSLYETAVEGYHVEVVEKLEEALLKAKSGEKYIVNLMLDRPQTHEKDYNQIIGMLELSIEDTIELTPTEYDNYVEDNWIWSSLASATNTMYAAKMSF